MEISAVFIIFERNDKSMINISGHFRDTRRSIGYENHDCKIMVNCCGYQKFLTKDYSQKRTIGRIDYQIIYIFKGCGHYLLKNQWQILSAGQILLFRPGEPQVYSYFFADEPEIYWIHFTGSECESLIRRFNLHTGFIGEKLTLKLLFQEIIMELQLKKAEFESIVNSDILKMFSLICRFFHEQHSNPVQESGIDRLVMCLNRDYAKPWNLYSMSQVCGLSQSHFSHAFKKRMGISPVQFITDIRINKAKELLECGTLSISAIAKLIGYDDALYFSKTFKKKTGVSPKEFIQNAMQEHSPD